MPTPESLAPSTARLPRSLLVILAAYLLIGVQYAVRTPAWQAPDEPAHYNFIRYLAQTGALPALKKGDYDQAYLAQLTSQRFPPGLSVDGLRYQNYQPPLYYLLAAPIYLATGGMLTALRLFSLGLGALGLAFLFLAVRELSGGDPTLALLAAGFAAFIPQHVAMLAAVDNDSLAELVIAAGLWWTLRQNRLGRRGPWTAGLILGAAFLTKVQAYILAPVMAALILWRWRQAGWRAWRPALREAVIVFGVAGALGALYWGRNWFVCGPLDLVCGNWHNQVVVGQPRTVEWIAQYGGAEVARRFLQTTFQSFWGQFGWMGVLMDQRVYLALLGFTVLLIIGAAGAARGWRGLTETTRVGVGLLALAGLLSLAIYLYYNLEFVQHQGRYLFPALVPIGFGAALSLRQWGRWAAAGLRRFPALAGWAAPVERWLPCAAPAALAALSLFALYRFILPALT